MAENHKRGTSVVFDTKIMDRLAEVIGPNSGTNFPIDIPDIRPDTSQFINPFNQQRWLAYFSKLLPRFKYARLLGLPRRNCHPPGAERGGDPCRLHGLLGHALGWMEEMHRHR